MTQQAKVVELVLPGGTEPQPALPGATTPWWIPTLVAVMLLGNTVLVWWRIRGRDPLDRAFAEAAGKVGLNRAERKRVKALASAEAAPVALLISESALDKASMGRDDDPLMVSVRRKLRSVVE